MDSSLVIGIIVIIRKTIPTNDGFFMMNKMDSLLVVYSC